MKRALLLLAILSLAVGLVQPCWSQQSVNARFDAAVVDWLGNYTGMVPQDQKAYLFVSSRTDDLSIGPLVMIMDIADLMGLTTDSREGFITFYAVLGDSFADGIPPVSTGIFTTEAGYIDRDPEITGNTTINLKAVVTGEMENSIVKPLSFSDTSRSITISPDAVVVGFELKADFFWSWFAQCYGSPNEPQGVADMLFNLFGPLSRFDDFVAALAADSTLYRANSGPFVGDMPLGVAFGEGSDNQDHFMYYIHDLGLHRTKVSFYWSILEPEPDQYDFERLDQYLDQLGPDDEALVNLFTDGWCTNQERESSHKGATLRQCPNDAASCEKSCEEYYREFVTRVAERVKERAHGGVRYFQRDTEPASGLHFPADKPQEYVEIQRIFYSAVKSVLPEVTVIGVNQNGNFKLNGMGEPYSDQFFEYVLEHMEDYYDALDLRLYEEYLTIPHRVKWFREGMRKNGYEKPVFSTEQGGPDPRTMHDGNNYLFSELLSRLETICGSSNDMAERDRCVRNWVSEHRDEISPKLRPFFNVGSEEENNFLEVIHCHDIVQRNLVMLASGVQATWWWNLKSPGKDFIFGQMRLRTPAMEELPGYACYKRLVSKMDGVTDVQQMDVGDQSIHLFEVKKGSDSSIFVAWHRDPRLDPYDSAQADPVPVSLPIPYQTVKVTDASGNEQTMRGNGGRLTISLSDTPVFIESQGSTPDQGEESAPFQVGLNFIRFYFKGTDPFSPDSIFQDFSDSGVQVYRHLVKAELTWANIEPKDDHWKFDITDSIIFNSPVPFIATVFDYSYTSGTPPWCTDSSQFQKTLGPEAKDYLDHVIERYGPYVKYWEIGNEMEHWRAADPANDREVDTLPQCLPAEGFSPQEQGRFLAQAAQYIREHDPNAVIVMPGIMGLSDYSINTWFAGVLEGGGSDWFDVVNYHYYGPWQNYVKQRAELEAFLKAHGLEDKPVWITETGSTSSPTLTLRTNYPNSPQTQAADVFRRLVAAWGAGDQLAIWHTYIGSEDQPENIWREYGLREADGSPKPALYSFRLLTSELVPFTKVEAISTSVGGSNIYRIETKSGAEKYVAWGSGSFTVPSGITQMVFVVPDDAGNFSWGTVTPGQEIALTDTPVLLK